MKTFIVFAAVIAAGYSKPIGQSESSPAMCPSNRDLFSAAAALGVGQAAASQAMAEQAVGNPNVPALVLSTNGVGGNVDQGEDTVQAVVFNLNSGDLTTYNQVDVYNEAAAGDSMVGSLSGADLAAVENSADSAASGDGAIVASATSFAAEYSD